MLIFRVINWLYKINLIVVIKYYSATSCVCYWNISNYDILDHVQHIDFLVKQLYM